MHNATLLLAPAEVRSPWRDAGPALRRRRRHLLLLVLVAFVAVGAVFGPPVGREVLTGWLLLVLWAACGGEWGVWRRAVVRDWLPLLGVLFAYDLLRGLAYRIGGLVFALPTYRSSPLDPELGATAHLVEPLRADSALFGGRIPTAWLQQHLYTPGTAHWYDLLTVVVYFSHFVVSLGLAVVLWGGAYRIFRRFLATLVTLTTAALITYAVYPAAPPWMASLNGYLPTTRPEGIVRVVPDTLAHLGGHTVNSAIERGEAYANPVAAIPSLHAAIPLMLLLFFWPLVGRWLRLALVTYTALMAFTLVYGGEHYVVDVLIGWLYATAALLGVRLVSRWRDASDRISDPRAPTTG